MSSTNQKPMFSTRVGGTYTQHSRRPIGGRDAWAISRIVGGTYKHSVYPIKNADFIDDNFWTLVGAVKMCRCGVLGTWWNIGSNSFSVSFRPFALCVKGRPIYYVPPCARLTKA